MTRLKNRLLMHSLMFWGATQGLSRASPCQYCFHCNRGNYSQETTTVVPSLRKKHARKDASNLSVPIVMNTCFKADFFPRWIRWRRTHYLMLAFCPWVWPKSMNECAIKSFPRHILVSS